MSATQARNVTVIRYSVLPGVSLDIVYNTPTGDFTAAILWSGGWARRDYTTEAGMRRAVVRLLDKIVHEEAAGGSGFWMGDTIPYAQHPKYGAVWTDWNPADGPRWDAQDDERNNKFHTAEHRAAVLARHNDSEGTDADSGGRGLAPEQVG